MGVRRREDWTDLFLSEVEWILSDVTLGVGSTVTCGKRISGER